jgi:hypothetical protein
MKRFWVIGLVSLLALGVVGFSLAHSQWGSSMLGRGHTNWHTPMMGHRDGNWKTHMLGRGLSTNWHMPMMDANDCWGNRAYHGWHGTTEPLTETEILTEEQAKTAVQNYTKATRNPNLKVGKVTETDTNFEVEIVTKDNSLVDKIVVDRRTGWTRSIY